MLIKITQMVFFKKKKKKKKTKRYEKSDKLDNDMTTIKYSFSSIH